MVRKPRSSKLGSTAKKIVEGVTLYWETESQRSKREGMGNEAGRGGTDAQEDGMATLPR